MIDRADMFHNHTKKIEFDVRGWSRSVCIEFYLCYLGLRPLSITNSSLYFVDRLSNSGGGEDPVWWWLRPRNALSKRNSSSAPNCSDNQPDLLRWFWISAEKNAYKQLTVKFSESSSEMFIKRLFINIGSTLDGRNHSRDNPLDMTQFHSEPFAPT
jgi:hypothetical protein